MKSKLCFSKTDVSLWMEIILHVILVCIVGGKTHKTWENVDTHHQELQRRDQ